MTPGGWFIDRFGARRALILMGLGTAVFVTLTGLVGQAVLVPLMALLYFLVIRSFMGSFSAPMYPASAKMVRHWIPPVQRAWANGLINGAAPVGMAVAHVLFGFLVRELSWQRAFLITGGATAVLAVVWIWYARDNPRGHPAVNAAELRLIEASDGQTVATTVRQTNWRLLLSSSPLLLLTLSYAAVGYFEYLFNFCSEFYFKGVLHVSEQTSQWYASIANLAQAVAMPIGGLVSDYLARHKSLKLGRALPPVAGMVGSAVALFAATLTQDEQWTLVCFALANFSIGAVEGSFWTTAVDIGGLHGGTAAAIVNTGGNAGGALAPYTTRGLGDLLGDWRPGFYLGSVICLCGAVLWWWINPAARIGEKVEDHSSSANRSNFR
jgi:MFS family permease